MRHGKKFNHLSRKTGHRKAMLGNMASSLIMHKRINTTVAKAKALRQFVEPLISKSKADSTHSRRIVFRNLQDKSAVSELFNEVAPKVAERNGGYTRIIKTGTRLGDNAEMCMIELVDFNELILTESKPKKKRTRRSKSSSSDAPKTESKKEEAPKTEAKADDKKEAPKAEEKKKEAPKAEAKADDKKDDAPKAEAKKEEKEAETPKAEKKDEKKSEAPKKADDKKDDADKEEKKED